MSVHKLVVIDGNLYFPYGAAWGRRTPEGNVPSLLVRRYEAGDCDTVPWPLAGEHDSLEDMQIRLAWTLYDERETNSRFACGDSIELPDGTAFDFDTILIEHEARHD